MSAISSPLRRRNLAVGQRQQLRGMKVAQIPDAGLAAGDGCPDCFYDNCFTHG